MTLRLAKKIRDRAMRAWRLPGSPTPVDILRQQGVSAAREAAMTRRLRRYWRRLPQRGVKS